MKIVDILKSVAAQSGIAETEIKTILENAAIGSIEVDDAIATRFTAPRLTMEAAKANPDLKKHFAKQALDGVDSKVLAIVQELELGDEAKTELTGIANTYEKVSALAKKVKDLEVKKAAATGGDKAALAKQINDLNQELVTLKTGFQNREKELNDGFERERIDWKFNSILSGFQYALPKDTPQEAVVAFGRTIADKAMTEKGLKLVKENGALVLKTSEGTDYFENNVRVGFNDFVQKSLANAKVLAASGPANPNPPANPPANPQNPNQGPINYGNFNQVLDDALSGLPKV